MEPVEGARHEEDARAPGHGQGDARGQQHVDDDTLSCHSQRSRKRTNASVPAKEATANTTARSK